MIRLLSALVLAAAPAAALASSFAATPVTTPSKARILASDISWVCGPDACLGSTDQSRPLVLCEDLASRAGRLTSFVADGRAFTPIQLDKCNAKAKGGAPLARAK